MNEIKTKKLVLASVFGAFIAVGTLMHIPVGNGYVNLGDVAILVCSVLLGPIAALSAAIGSAMIDSYLGYHVYVPATIVIKGVMSLVCAKMLFNKKRNTVSKISVFCLCETIMIVGYFVYTSFMFDFATAIAAVLGNVIQAILAVFGATILSSFFEKIDIAKKLNLK